MPSNNLGPPESPPGKGPPLPGSLSLRAVTICLAGAFEGGLVLLALFLGQWLEPSPTQQVAWNWQGLWVGVAAALPMLLVMLSIQRLPWGPFVRLRKLVDNVLIPMFKDCSLLDLAMIALLAGLGEEALFRGVVQKFLADHLNIWLALAIASLLFGLAHMMTPTYAVLASVMGAYLGYLAIYFENLLPSIVCHAVYDFLALVYLVREHTQRPAATGA